MWGLFTATALLSQLVFQFGWTSTQYEVYLAMSGVLSLAAALWLLLKLKRRWTSYLLVFLGLVVGQWWFVEGVLAQAIWSIFGFVK